MRQRRSDSPTTAARSVDRHEHHDDARLDALPCTRADTAQLHEVLGHPAIGGFETVGIAHDLSAAGLRSAIAEFLDGCEEDELALLYISGHGARLVESGGEFFFMATDSDIDDLARTGVGASFVNERLEGCFAQQKVAILDCCHSGGFALGFRTVDGPAKSATPARIGVPLTARGVYVLSSSAVEQASFGGADAPEPSVFTASVVETLRTGAAGGSVGGDVTVDELFDAVSERLRGSGQRPVKSALHVDGPIQIASRPRGPVPPTATSSTQTAPSTGRPPPVAPDPQWPALLGYFRDAVQAGMAAFELLTVSGGPFACLPGPERLLTADLDADDCLPVPTDAASLVTTAVENRLQLWAGRPAVILTERGRRQFAPLLIRRVGVVTDDSGTARLKPDGTVLPHPGLARALLDEDDAAELLTTYQPSWRAGERERLGSDAAYLLHELDVHIVDELRPAALSERFDEAGPGDGAVNVAVLFATETTQYDKGLLADLDKLRGMPDRITGTALAALLDHGKLAYKGSLVVSPLPANARQRAVLQAAMTRRLTVATGPPGTGKSQLIVDVVATAIAAGQSVLVASTNNGAVNEVWRRCDELVPGSVVRTGSGVNQAHELDGLEKLCKAPGPEVTPATLREAHRSAAKQLDRCRTTLQEVAECELCLIETRARLRAAAGRLDVDPAWRPAQGHEGDGGRPGARPRLGGDVPIRTPLPALPGVVRPRRHRRGQPVPNPARRSTAVPRPARPHCRRCHAAAAHQRAVAAPRPGAAQSARDRLRLGRRALPVRPTPLRLPRRPARRQRRQPDARRALPQPSRDRRAGEPAVLRRRAHRAHRNSWPPCTHGPIHPLARCAGAVDPGTERRIVAQRRRSGRDCRVRRAVAGATPAGGHNWRRHSLSRPEQRPETAARRRQGQARRPRSGGYRSHVSRRRTRCHSPHAGSRPQCACAQLSLDRPAAAALERRDHPSPLEPHRDRGPGAVVPPWWSRCRACGGLWNSTRRARTRRGTPNPALPPPASRRPGRPTPCRCQRTHRRRPAR
ncbi:MAG: hypothetical protein DLM60_17710 [Pseudonocardiales bacterium]|nr:MAG: hypothetical protein DLM60_17710 [Pseudonocardiales bacterium]